MDNLIENTGAQQVLNSIQLWFGGLDLVALDIVLFAGLLVSWFALFVALVAVKKVKKQEASSYRLYEKIVHDLHIAGSGAIGMGQRIIALEKRLARESAIVDEAVEVARPTLKAVPKVSAPAPVEIDPLKAMFAEKVPVIVSHQGHASDELRSLKSAELQQSAPQQSVPQQSILQQSVLQKIEDPFEVAKGLLRRGIAQAEVAKRCGLSLSETALMAMVLNNKNASSASRLAS